MHGIPFDTAFQLDDLTRAAFSIAISEMNGNKFDWRAMRFEDES